MKKELGFVDMDGVIADFNGKIETLLPNQAEIIDHDERERIIGPLYENTPGFFRDLKPLPGAVKAFKKLSEYYDLYILSVPSWKNHSSWTDKRLWVEEYLGEEAEQKLILTHNKGLFTGKFLIDDRIKYGVDKFQGEHIHFGTSKFPDWESVIKYLIPLY